MNANPDISQTADRIQHLATQIRRDALIQIHAAGSGHPGGSLSCADLLAVLYGEVLNLKQEPRDRFILSKGHAVPALYAAWVNTGLVDKAEMDGFRQLNRSFQGHPHALATPLAETSTGSLGQGFSVAIGMALGYIHQRGTGKVYVMLGDGELQEGIVWEAAMSAAHYKLDNLVAIIDYNKLQSDDNNANIMGLEPLADKWQAFGWQVAEIDGHDLESIRDTLNKNYRQPAVIIAHTMKGKGVSWMENIPAWHGSVKLLDDELALALGELKI